MLYLFLLLLFPLALAYSLYTSDRDCFALSTIQKEFKTDFSNKNPPKFNDEIVYFFSDNAKSHYVNGLRISYSEDGVFCKGGIIYPWIKSFFIPWRLLKKTGEKRCYFVKKDIYQVEGFDISIAVSKQDGVK